MDQGQGNGCQGHVGTEGCLGWSKPISSCSWFWKTGVRIYRSLQIVAYGAAVWGYLAHDWFEQQNKLELGSKFSKSQSNRASVDERSPASQHAALKWSGASTSVSIYHRAVLGGLVEAMHGAAPESSPQRLQMSRLFCCIGAEIGIPCFSEEAFLLGRTENPGHLCFIASIGNNWASGHYVMADGCIQYCKDCRIFDKDQ